MICSYSMDTSTYDMYPYIHMYVLVLHIYHVWQFLVLIMGPNEPTPNHG